jgi:hypothetical protein
MTSEGCFENHKVSTEYAVEIFKKLADNGSGFYENYISAIGHQATADALNEILGLTGSDKIPAIRRDITTKPDDICLCFKVKGRLPEGAVLNNEELKSIGFEFYRIVHLRDGVYQIASGTAMASNEAINFDQVNQNAAYMGAYASVV